MLIGVMMRYVRTVVSILTAVAFLAAGTSIAAQQPPKPVPKTTPKAPAKPAPAKGTPAPKVVEEKQPLHYRHLHRISK